jgi:hypothetical protein
MVIDKIREIYLTHCHEGTEQDFNFPLEFANSLSQDEDAPILRLLVDLLNDGSRKGHDHAERKHLADYTIQLQEWRSLGWGGSMDLQTRTPLQ